jgi:hypothetical protein
MISIVQADTIQVDDQTIVIVVDCPGLFLKLKRDNSTQQIPHDCQSHFEITYLPNLNGRPCLKLQGKCVLIRNKIKRFQYCRIFCVHVFIRRIFSF